MMRRMRPVLASAALVVLLGGCQQSQEQEPTGAADCAQYQRSWEAAYQRWQEADEKAPGLAGSPETRHWNDMMRQAREDAEAHGCTVP